MVENAKRKKKLILSNIDTQVKKMMANIRQYVVPLHKYQAMMDLQVPI